MAKMFISERAIFPNKTSQKRFVRECVFAVGGKKKTSELLSMSERTIADWGMGKFSMPYKSAVLLQKAARIPFPVGTDKQYLTDHLRQISKKGGRAVYARYGKIGGDTRKRQEAWRAWWHSSRIQNRNPLFKPRAVALPLHSEMLAEFFGIMLGDGSVAPYHIAITLNATRDAAYAHFVEQLLCRLFKVKPKRYRKKGRDAVDIVLHRKKIVSFCTHLGLPLGNKLRQPVGIPMWIKKNPVFVRACIRGLVDTDGSVFKHRYQVKGRNYSYTKIGFSSASPQLLDAMYTMLINSGIGAKKKYTFREIRIENSRFADLYMRVIGSHNPKHTAMWRK